MSGRLPRAAVMSLSLSALRHVGPRRAFFIQNAISQTSGINLQCCLISDLELLSAIWGSPGVESVWLRRVESLGVHVAPGKISIVAEASFFGAVEKVSTLRPTAIIVVHIFPFFSFFTVQSTEG